MFNIELGKSGLEVSTVAVGCMRFCNMEEKQIAEFLDTAIGMGVNFFDHADIYGDGESEKAFGKAIKSFGRENVFVQTKCGIVPRRMFDFSYEHIMESVEGSLKRLDTDYIDVLLLHRPDALMEPEEVAKAFGELKAAGKVRHFGVSNQNPYQMKLLESHLDMPLCANQLQFGIMHAQMVHSGINVNTYNETAADRDGSVLDFCRLNNITIQPWSPMQYGFMKGCFIDNDMFPELNRVMDELSVKYGVSKTTLAFAWILRHPAKMQPITGTTNVGRLTDCIKGADVRLTREDWYKIYLAAGNILP